jgi:hypothetical protein
MTGVVGASFLAVPQIIAGVVVENVVARAANQSMMAAEPIKKVVSATPNDRVARAAASSNSQRLCLPRPGESLPHLADAPRFWEVRLLEAGAASSARLGL